MAYTLKDTRTPFRGGKNILASSWNLQYIEEGVTLDATAIGKKYLPVGTPIMRNLTTGKFVVYQDGGTVPAPEAPTGHDEFCILNVDIDCDGEHDVFVGEALVRASVYEAKLPETVTATFKSLTKPMIRYVKNI